MHPAVLDFVRGHATAARVAVADLGGQDMNGSCRSLFPAADTYVCVDIAPGRGVDVVADAATWRPGRTFDVVVCAEVFEHTPAWPAIVGTAAAILRPGGLFIATCAGPGRAPHSGRSAGPIEPDEWYRNVPAGLVHRACVSAGLAPLVARTLGLDTQVAARKGHAVDVIVPVLDRPHAAARFMASVTAGTPRGVAQVTAVASSSDTATADAWRAAGATVLVVADGDGSFARKANHGAAATSAPWLLLAGDDVAFRPGWWDAVMDAAADGAQVIGTNDDARPGDDSPHPVIARSYVEQVGASWDGPGIVCHPGYAHNYVDSEILAAARERGVYRYAAGAVLHHLHHSWDRAPVDATYERGTATLHRDRRLFSVRFARH